jgi:hypothetical protein
MLPLLALIVSVTTAGWHPGDVPDSAWENIVENLRKAKSQENVKAFLFPLFDEYLSFNLDLQALLEKVDIFLTKNSVPYCAAGGTLVGSIRHQAILPYDTDGGGCWVALVSHDVIP